MRVPKNNEEDWKLTGTEIVMHNFEESTITYEVELENHTTFESRNYEIAFISNIILDKKDFADN